MDRKWTGQNSSDSQNKSSNKIKPSEVKNQISLKLTIRPEVGKKRSGSDQKNGRHKILRTQTTIGQTELVRPPNHISRRPEQMSDQKEIGLDLCQSNFFWSGPDRYLPTSDRDC